MISTVNVLRYSNAELAEFKDRIERKLSYAQEEYNFISEQIKDQTESIENEGDWMDSSSNTSDLEMMYLMANRQRKHIEDLEKALLRVANKTYGICTITGELIDKRRLMAVPTTAKCLAAKLGEVPPKELKAEEEVEKPKKVKAKQEPIIISRVIKKSGVVAAKFVDDEEEDDEEENLDFDELEDDVGYVVAEEETELDDLVDPSSLEDED